MSENSAFWDNELVGDAASATGWEAPYLSREKVEILDLLLGNDDQGYVIPERGFDLKIEAEDPVSMNINILSGNAFVKGRLYENTTTASLTIGANASGSPRIDRIILRTSFAAQTIRLAILQGTPGATPALPTLTQDANTWEVSLAYIWVASGTTSIPDEEIHDERVFLLSFSAINKSNPSFNHIQNSELIALNNYYRAYDKTDDPSYWDSVYYSANEPYTKPDQMARGRALKITSIDPPDPPYTDGLSQTFKVKPDTMYAIRALVQVDPGIVGEITIETDSYASNTINKSIRRSGEWLDNYFYYKTEHDATEMAFTFEFLINTGDTVYLGQVLVIEGYYPGNYRAFSELIFSTHITLGQVQNDPHSTETVVWDMPTSNPDFGAYIGEDVKSLLIYGSIPNTSNPFSYGVKYRAYGGSSILFGIIPSGAERVWITNVFEIPLIDQKFEVDYISPGTNQLLTSMSIV